MARAEKHYKAPRFEHYLRLNMSLETFKRLLREMREKGYQVAAHRNIYEDELFKITGFAGTVYEIEGVAQNLDDEAIEIRYNKRYDKMGLSPVERTASILALILVNSLLFYLLYVFSPNNLLGASLLILNIIALPISLISILLLLIRNVYQRENNQAIAGLEKLEADFLEMFHQEKLLDEAVANDDEEQPRNKTKIQF